MKKAPIGAAIALCALANSSYSAGDVTFIASLAYQDKELTFDQQYSGAANNSADFSVNLPMVTTSATLAFWKMFVSLKYEANLSDTSTTTSETNRSLVLESNLLTHPGGTIDVGREDISFTVGFNVWKKLNLFAGYLSGETELTPDPFCANPFPSNNPQFDNIPDAPATIACSRTNRAFQQFFIGDLPAGQIDEPSYYVANQPSYKQEYTEKGLFVGASYGFNINDMGTLSLNLAYASMDGQYKDNANDPTNIFTSFTAFDYEGDTTGTSIGVSWTSSLGDTTAYYVDIRRQSYSMDGRDQTGNLSNVGLDTDETMEGITAGIQFYF